MPRIERIAISYVVRDFFGSSHNQVNPKTPSPEQAFDLASHLAVGGVAVLDDEEIESQVLDVHRLDRVGQIEAEHFRIEV